MRSCFMAVLILTSALSLNSFAQNSKNGLEEAKKAIAASNAIYFKLYAKNDGSILSRYAPDACLLPADYPVLCGREGLLKFFKNSWDKGIRGGKFTTINVYGDGIEFVTEVGLGQVFDANGKLVHDGKYLVLWKKTKEGWKMFRDSFSNNSVQK